MKSWINRIQAEFYIDSVEVSGDKLTIVQHSHLDGTKQENAQLLGARELEKHRVLTTFARFMPVKGLGESKGDIPGNQGGELK